VDPRSPLTQHSHRTRQPETDRQSTPAFGRPVLIITMPRRMGGQRDDATASPGAGPRCSHKEAEEREGRPGAARLQPTRSSRTYRPLPGGSMAFSPIEGSAGFSPAQGVGGRVGAIGDRRPAGRRVKAFLRARASDKCRRGRVSRTAGSPRLGKAPGILASLAAAGGCGETWDVAHRESGNSRSPGPAVTSTENCDACPEGNIFFLSIPR